MIVEGRSVRSAPALGTARGEVTLQMQQVKKFFYETDSIGLASYLRFLFGAAPSYRWREADGKCVFSFVIEQDSSDAVDEAIRLYQAGKALVEPRQYHEIVFLVKQGMYRSRSGH